MTEHVNFLLLGLGNGAVYAALAMALVVTYRGSGVLNFATGGLALFGAYTYAFLRLGELLIPIPGLPTSIDLGGPMGFWPAVVITLAIQALLGVLLYVVVFRPLRHARPVAKAVASLGVLAVITAVLAMKVGASQIIVERIFPADIYNIGDVHVVGDRAWFAVTVIAVTFAIAAAYRYTRFGLATRACSETEMGALVTGLSPDRVALSNWAISAMVAGLAGILISPLTPLVPGSFTLLIVPALAAAVLGRFTALVPAVLGGLAIGMFQSEAVYLRGQNAWFPQNGVAELIPLVLVLGVLLFRSRPLPRRGDLIEQTLGRAPRARSFLLPIVIAVPPAIVAVYLLEGSYRSALMTSFIVAIISLSLVVVTGYVGQISLAQLTLAGVAAFLLQPLGDALGVGFPIAPLLAALGATVIGVVVGLPALRIRGLLVGVVTLTLATTIEAIWFRNNDLNGGNEGLNIAAPHLFGLDLGIGRGADYPRPEFGLLCLFVLVVVAVLVALLRASRSGSAMLAVRANERSAAAAGINVVRTKLVGFGIAAFIAGIGGTLLAYKQTNVTWESFSALAGLLVFTTAYLAGITSVSGGIVAGALTAGGIVFVSADRLVDIGDWYGIVTGALVVFTVIKNPEGIVGPAHLWLDRRRQRRVVTLPIPAAPTSPPAVVTPLTRSPGAVPALSVEELRVHYGGVVAVEDVSFAVPTRGIVGVIGPNGAGKTTLMDAVSGFTAYTGRVHLGDVTLDGLAPHRRARLGLGRTFQGVDLYEDLSVFENVVAGAHDRRRGRWWRPTQHHGDPAVDGVLDQLGLTPFRERNVRELSQGHRQLVSIARALAGEPTVLMLDESAAGLDARESAWLAEQLRTIRDAGTTIVLIDHDMSFVLGLCDEIHVLDFGQLIASGPPATITSHAGVAAAYLGSTHATTRAG